MPVPALVVAYVEAECVRFADQAANGWFIESGPSISNDGSFSVTFKNVIFYGPFNLGKETWWVDVQGSLATGAYSVKGRGSDLVDWIDFYSGMVASRIDAWQQAFSNGTMATTPNVVPQPIGPKVGQHYRIRNVWHPDQCLNIEAGHLQLSAIQSGWVSAWWQLQQISNDLIYRIQNVWKPDQFLHVQNGPVEAGTIAVGWQSAWWTLQPVSQSKYRIQNGWNRSLFLNNENGPLVAGPALDGWLSARWSFELVALSQFQVARVKNTCTFPVNFSFRWKPSAAWSAAISLAPGAIETFWCQDVDIRPQVGFDFDLSSANQQTTKVTGYDNIFTLSNPQWSDRDRQGVLSWAEFFLRTADQIDLRYFREQNGIEVVDNTR